MRSLEVAANRKNGQARYGNKGKARKGKERHGTETKGRERQGKERSRQERTGLLVVPQESSMTSCSKLHVAAVLICAPHTHDLLPHSHTHFVSPLSFSMLCRLLVKTCGVSHLLGHLLHPSVLRLDFLSLHGFPAVVAQ